MASKSFREIYSKDGNHRVVLLVDSAGRFILETHAFCQEHGLSEWENTTLGLHLFDSEQAATQAAHELLRNQQG